MSAKTTKQLVSERSNAMTTTQTIQDKCAQILRLSEAATKGPWAISDSQHGLFIQATDEFDVAHLSPRMEMNENASLIASSRTFAAQSATALGILLRGMEELDMGYSVYTPREWLESALAAFTQPTKEEGM